MDIPDCKLRSKGPLAEHNTRPLDEMISIENTLAFLTEIKSRKVTPSQVTPSQVTPSHVDSLFAKAIAGRTALDEILAERIRELEDDAAHQKDVVADITSKLIELGDTAGHQKDLIANLTSRLFKLEATAGTHLLPLHQDTLEDGENSVNSSSLWPSPLSSPPQSPASIKPRPAPDNKTARSSRNLNFPIPVEIATGRNPKISSMPHIATTAKTDHVKTQQPHATPQVAINPAPAATLDRSASPASAKLDSKRLLGNARSPIKMEEKNLYRDEWFKNGKQGTLEEFARRQRSQLKVDSNMKRSHSTSASDLVDAFTSGEFTSKIARLPKKTKKTPVQPIAVPLNKKRKQEEMASEEVAGKKRVRMSPETFAADTGHLSPWKSPVSDDGKYSTMHGPSPGPTTPSSLLSSFKPRKKN